jgi:Flp pilus assembly pilin Flp
MLKFLKHLLRNEFAVTSTEYAIIACIIMLGILYSVTGMGTNTSKPFQQSGNAIQTTVGSP